MSDYAQQLAAELNLSAKNVQGAIDLIDQGNTIPFIARYRKEVTGSMDDQVRVIWVTAWNTCAAWISARRRSLPPSPSRAP